MVVVVKNIKLNFLWPKMACLGPPFWTQNPPEKVYVGPFFCVLSQEMRHIMSKSGVLGGGQKVYVEKKYGLFLSPRNFDINFK